MSPLTESTRLTLAKTPGTGLDADAQAYIAAVEAADTAAGQSGGLEAGVKWNIDQFVRGCKADGIWTAIKACCILSGARTLAGALVPLVGTAPTNNNFVTGDYVRKTGLVGNGTSKYLNSNRNNNADPQNNQHLSVYASTVAPGGLNKYPIYIGSSTVTGASHFGRDQNSATLFSRSRNSTANLGVGNATTVGLLAISRNSASSFILRTGNTNNSITQNSQAPGSEILNVFVGDPTGSDLYSNARLAFYSIGESLDLALLDTRISTLITSNALVIP